MRGNGNNEAAKRGRRLVGWTKGCGCSDIRGDWQHDLRSDPARKTHPRDRKPTPKELQELIFTINGKEVWR